MVVLGPEVVRKLFGTENPIGKEVQIKDISFQVIGVTAAKGSFAGANEDDGAYIPITTMATQIEAQASPYGIPVGHIDVSAANKDSVRAAAFQITNILTQRHGKKTFSLSRISRFKTLSGK